MEIVLKSLRMSDKLRRGDQKLRLSLTIAILREIYNFCEKKECEN